MFEGKVVRALQRITAGEVVRVVNMTSSTQTFAPTRPTWIKTLACIATSYKNRTVTLQWTAVGDYLNERGKDSEIISSSSSVDRILFSYVS